MKNNTTPVPLHLKKHRGPESERKQQTIVTVLEKQTTTAPREEDAPSVAATISAHKKEDTGLCVTGLCVPDLSQRLWGFLY